MSNHRSIRDILLHHRQVNAGRARKAERVEHRLYMFQLTRAGIRVKVEADRQYLAVCAMVFVIGLMLVASGIFYLAGMILYG